MSFTNGKPWTVTEEDEHLDWSCGKDGKYFRCALCGHKFKAGDIARWQYTNDVPGAGGNPMLCQKCDGPKEKIVAEIKRRLDEFNAERNWWFRRRIDTDDSI